MHARHRRWCLVFALLNFPQHLLSNNKTFWGQVMKEQQHGLTLFESIIALAVMTFFAAIVFPAYQNHTISARIQEGLQQAAPAKQAVTVALKNQRNIIKQTGLAYRSHDFSENIDTIAIAEKRGVITITYSKLAGGGTIILTPHLSHQGIVTWDCKGGSVPKRYRPVACR